MRPAIVLTASRVVVGETVGVRFSGQSMREAGRPVSFVTVKTNFLLIAHGFGDCGMFM